MPTKRARSRPADDSGLPPIDTGIVELPPLIAGDVGLPLLDAGNVGLLPFNINDVGLRPLDSRNGLLPLAKPRKG